eukprot:scaffold285793_cov30-Tisochrysis_lutea.AAC.2
MSVHESSQGRISHQESWYMDTTSNGSLVVPLFLLSWSTRTTTEEASADSSPNTIDCSVGKVVERSHRIDSLASQSRSENSSSGFSPGASVRSTLCNELLRPPPYRQPLGGGGGEGKGGGCSGEESGGAAKSSLGE